MAANLRDSTISVPEIIHGEHSPFSARKQKKFQIMDIAPMDKANVPIDMELDVPDLSLEYTDMPVSGFTAKYNDGGIIKAMEAYGNDCDVTLKTVAKNLELPFVKFMYRVMSSPTLTSYLAIIRRIRAQTLSEKRDAIYKHLEEITHDADAPVPKMYVMVELSKIKSIENEMSKLDRELYGNHKLSVGVKTTHTQSAVSNEFVISTSLQETAK